MRVVGVLVALIWLWGPLAAFAGSLPLLGAGPGTASAPIVAEYTYVGSISSPGDNPSLVISGSIDIGTAASDRLVIVGATLGNSNVAITGVTVNGVSLSLVDRDLTNVVGGAELWSGLVTSGSGSQTVAVTWGSGVSFLERAITVWTATGLSSDTAKQTAVNEANISVDAGDFLFAIGVSTFSNDLSFSTFSQAPTEHSVDTGDFETVAGDETVVSTNASFSTAATNAAALAVATFE